jgi:hypothetical protein
VAATLPAGLERLGPGTRTFLAGLEPAEARPFLGWLAAPGGRPAGRAQQAIADCSEPLGFVLDKYRRAHPGEPALERWAALRAAPAGRQPFAEAG